MDRTTKGMLNYAAKLGPRTSYRFFLLRPGSSKPEVIATKPVREPAYMHSFGLTERWLVLAEFPFVVNPPRLAFSGRPYIENYRWKPELGTRFHLFDRATGKSVGPFETEPRFAFHHVNSYEDDGEVVVDICTFPDAGIVEDLYMERLRAGKPVTPGYLERFRISPEAGTVTIERLIDESIELPRINYGRCNERPYRYAWGVGTDGGWIDRIVKADVVERRSTAGSRKAASPASRCSSRPPMRRLRTRVCCSRSSSTPSRATPSCSCSTLARSTSSPEPRCRTTSRSASTASSRGVELPPQISLPLVRQEVLPRRKTEARGPEEWALFGRTR